LFCIIINPISFPINHPHGIHVNVYFPTHHPFQLWLS
jgi:hypothetical protein